MRNHLDRLDRRPCGVGGIGAQQRHGDLVTGAEVLAAPQAGPAGSMPGARMLDRLVRADNEGHGPGP